MKYIVLSVFGVLLVGSAMAGDNNTAPSKITKKVGSSSGRFTYHVNGKIVDKPPIRNSAGLKYKEALYPTGNIDFNEMNGRSDDGVTPGMENKLPQLTPVQKALISGWSLDGNQKQLDADFDDVGDWVRLNPQPIGDDIFVLQLFDSNHIRALAGVGTYLRSDDGGNHWDVYYEMGGLTDADQLLAMSFYDSLNGYICTKDKMLRTDDGGDSWTLLPPFTPGIDNPLVDWYFVYSEFPCNITCLSPLDVVAWVNNNYYRSTDGGNTWTGSNLGNWPGTYYHNLARRPTLWPLGGQVASFMGSQIVDSTTYVVAPYNSGVWRTTDAGATWNMIRSDNVLSLHFYDRNNGVVANTDSSLYVTTNGGSSWITRQLPGSPVTNYHMCFMSSPGTIYATGIDFNVSIGDIVYPSTTLHTSIFKSTDGGVMWSSASWVGARPVVLVAAESQGKIVLGGTQGFLLKSNPDGQTWEKLSEGISITNRNGAVSPDGTHLITVGSSVGFDIVQGTAFDGMVSISSDGGQSWSETESLSTQPLSASVFINNTTALVAGFGEIFKTTNNGTTWIEKSFGLSTTCNSIDFMDENIGIAVGSNNGIFLARTTDGGETWTSLSIGNYVGYTVQHFGSTFIIAGRSFSPDSAVLLRSSDAGITWSNVLSVQTTANTNNTGWDSPAPPRFNSVVFADSETVYAFGGYEIYYQYNYKSTDAGLTWSPISEIPWTVTYDKLYTAYPLYARAVDRNTVVLSSWLWGLTGRLYLTTDGGSSWQDLHIPYDYSLGLKPRPLCAPTENGGTVVYFMQNNGVILSQPFGPFDAKNWIGSIDSSWFNSSNWSPIGVPGPGDSVTINPALNGCVLDQSQFLVAIASLNVATGGSLTVTDSVSRFVIAKDVLIDGSLVVSSDGVTQIVVGGSWIDNSGGNALTNKAFSAMSSEGFSPGNSTVTFQGDDVVKGIFYTVNMDTGSAMVSQGNISVGHSIRLLDNFDVLPADTLVVTSDDPVAITGNGVIRRGTIKRSIRPGSTSPYRFESSKSYVQFNGTGINPSDITVTTYPDTQVADSGEIWVVVPSYVDTATNTIRADTVTHFSKWTFGRPRPSVIVSGAATLGDPDVQRIYAISASGDSFSCQLSLHYEASELPDGVPEDSLVLLRQLITTTGSVHNRWNIISLPVAVENDSVKSVFPTSVNNSLYAYVPGSGYEQRAMLEQGRGYWLKFSSAQSVWTLSEESQTVDSINVSTGWNLIGSLSEPVSVSSITSIPSGIIASQFFGYNNGYVVATQLNPFQGYWIKVNNSGQLVMNSGSMAPKAVSVKNPLEQFNTLTLMDADGNKQILYFGHSGKSTEERYELPPLSPGLSFDARFGSGSMVGKAKENDITELPIAITSANYPVTLQWHLIDSKQSAELSISNKIIPLSNDNGTTTVTDKNSGITLRFAGSPAIPKQYALEQNFPNPFNPSTTIRYELPVDSKVTLRIYNLLGQVVSTLTDEIQSPGYKSTAWNAYNFASGVYFYKLESVSVAEPGRSFTQVKKMLLLK